MDSGVFPTLSPQQTPAIIGHRGAPAHLPEHTEESYRLAIRQGCDFVEPDVVPTSDGVLLVRHEPLLDDTTDVAAHPEFAALRHDAETVGEEQAGWYATDFSWAMLQRLRAVERLPQLRPASHAHSGRSPLLRLRELVRLVDAAAVERGRDCGLVIELKWDTWMLERGFDYRQLLERELAPVREARSLRGMRIESFEPGVLDRLRTVTWLRDLDARLVLLVEDAPLARAGEEGPSRLTDAGLDDAAARFDGISVRTTLLTRELVEHAHARGLEVFSYTLRGEDEFLPEAYAGQPAEYWRMLAATGVDAVFADDPAAVRAVLEANCALANEGRAH